ncbi:succinyl-diaminopimelate desuccinylase [Actinobacteria bacterium YIM 96077]|uniref:Succinyl-diaminopimelate desuccinylase n=1 Tax=Phytoactinopolyspora halophila TaxID=1981511 RepID=A0A329QRR0_9ACTN|nr:succinyl-diaminopimelate desuccinylase [Phytoactinopolyspora halophila]AYY15634.1 succinyl-diaminopimelate desuccinylase [Actinobacteria bacterium YIM 96077]RAW14903.1 succinyl-diaminopimelate desuccinylase [Phytoactinopolyspora halophila]
MVTRLDLDLPAPELTAAICDIPSVSGSEAELAAAVERALDECAHLTVVRDGDSVVAWTSTGDRADRVIVAGHLDTVPIADNLPTAREGDVLWGRGTVDMKGGIAVMLRLAAHITAPSRDVTYVFYDNEEVAADANGLGRIARTHPAWLDGDFAVLMEPTSAVVEGGCNGTLRVAITVEGKAAHSARWWMGDNAIHGVAPILDRLRAYQPAEVDVDGLTYREGLNAVGIEGGIAGNVIPDRCTVMVNYRFAPNRSEDEALAHVQEVFEGFDVTLADSAPGARPGLGEPAAAAFVRAVDVEVRAKEGWTDVARFSGLGVPAVNYGPGDPLLAHADDERVDTREIVACEERIRAWLAR